jgi:hypothetical protein
MSEESLSLRAVSLLLPEPGEEGPGAATTLYEYATRSFDGAAVPWSPDEARVAVRNRTHELSTTGTRRSWRDCDKVLELSAEDWSGLAQHSFECADESSFWSPLIWPARER